MSELETLTKENTRLIIENNDLAKRIRSCETLCFSLETKITQLAEIVELQSKKIETLENLISLLQKQVENMKH